MIFLMVIMGAFLRTINFLSFFIMGKTMSLLFFWIVFRIVVNGFLSQISEILEQVNLNAFFHNILLRLLILYEC